MNLVYEFLLKFRDFCVSKIFDQNLDLYIGSDPHILARKEFYRSFIGNVIFDRSKPISSIANIDLSNAVNPVYVVADSIFTEVQKARATKLDSCTDFNKEAEYINQLIQVLIVLKVHFCKYAARHSFEPIGNYFDKPKDLYITSPDKWDFLPSMLILRKLNKMNEYSMDLTYTNSHKLNDSFIDSFTCEISKGNFDRKLIFTSSAFNELFDTLVSKGYTMEKPFLETSNVVPRFFSREKNLEDSFKRFIYKFFFVKEMGVFYYLAGFIYDEYNFDLSEYRDEISDNSCEVCLDDRVRNVFSEGVQVTPHSCIDIYE